jgi:hypothetical protein
VPPKTLNDHEQQHAQSQDDHTAEYEDRIRGMLHKCMTAACESARIHDLTLYLAYQVADEKADAALLDWQDANTADPPQSITDKRINYLNSLITALNAYFDWTKARDAADQACGSSQ